MKLTIVKIASVGIILAFSVLPARAEWFHYVVRTSGLGWSDGYHAYDQCPPKERKHFPIKHPFVLPGCGASSAPHAPYYFEKDVGEETLPASPQRVTLPPIESPPINTPQSPLNALPDPQAHYTPRSRYFEALQAEARGSELQQPAQQQARRAMPVTGARPPF